MKVDVLPCEKVDESICDSCFELPASEFVLLKFEEPYHALFGLGEGEGVVLGFCWPCWGDLDGDERAFLAVDAAMEVFELEAEKN